MQADRGTRRRAGRRRRPSPRQVPSPVARPSADPDRDRKQQQACAIIKLDHSTDFIKHLNSKQEVVARPLWRRGLGNRRPRRQPTAAAPTRARAFGERLEARLVRPLVVIVVVAAPLFIKLWSEELFNVGHAIIEREYRDTRCRRRTRTRSTVNDLELKRPTRRTRCLGSQPTLTTATAAHDDAT